MIRRWFSFRDAGMRRGFVWTLLTTLVITLIVVPTTVFVTRNLLWTSAIPWWVYTLAYPEIQRRMSPSEVVPSPAMASQPDADIEGQTARHLAPAGSSLSQWIPPIAWLCLSTALWSVATLVWVSANAPVFGAFVAALALLVGWGNTLSHVARYGRPEAGTVLQSALAYRGRAIYFTAMQAFYLAMAVTSAVQGGDSP
jgi:hypothetical protein